jgi:UDP-2,3-diacylglucosamine pyrophosphatase LpxH
LKKRRIEIAVISNIHLGSTQCQAGALLAYLSSISPKVLVLSGAFLDNHHAVVSTFPREHFRVFKKIFDMAASGTKIYYLCGDRDGTLKSALNLSLGDLHLTKDLFMELDGKRTWFTQGEFLDSRLLRNRWAQRLAPGLLLSLARVLRFRGRVWGRTEMDIAGPGADRMNQADHRAPEPFLFGEVAARLAAARRCEYVICGAPHRAQNSWFEGPYGKCQFLSPGDWVQNLTALEYNFKRWKPYHYREDKLSPFFADEDLKAMDMEELLSKNEKTGGAVA